MDPAESDPLPAGPTPQGEPRALWSRLLGVRSRPGKRIGWGLTLWGWCLLTMLVLGVGGAGFAEYSMQPSFCNSCHIMTPYYEAWHQSNHRDVPCVDCHFDPGLKNTLMGKWQASSQAVKYITQTYGSKPHAEVHDAACLRSGCHETRLLEGKVKWDVKNARGDTVTIRFDHTPHLNQVRRGQQLRCVSCHSQIVQGQHIVVTVDTCFLCHFKGLEHGRKNQTLGGCTGCHDAPKGQIRLATGLFDHKDYLQRGVTCENCHSDSVKGDGAVPRQVCWNCHNQTAQVAKYDQTQSVHRTHVTDHKVECSSCHVRIEHTLAAGATQVEQTVNGSHMRVESGTCGQCHEQTHGGPMELYRGTGARGVPDMPSPMSRAQVDCIACHRGQEHPGDVAEVVGQTFVATQSRCDYCHGDRYAGKLEEWKTTIAAQQRRAEAAYAQAKGALSKSDLSGTLRLQADRLLDDAEHNIRLVKLAHGVHNVSYATAALNLAIGNCQQVNQIIAGKPVAPREGP
jgi:nitrate/TMAO reductase-like tetraheme cytochrome c subunit